MAVAAFRGSCLAAALAAILPLALTGCGAIDAYRSVRGLDADDAGPNAPFTKNLAAGETAPYPNLSTVPPPPTRASTTAERAELTKRLIAERTSTETEAAPLQAAVSPAQTAPASPGPVPAAPTVEAAPVKMASAAPAPPSGAATEAAGAAASPKTAGTAPTPARQSDRHAGHEPHEAPPQESTLQMPEIASVPIPEAGRPAPPPPHLTLAPAIAAVDLPKTATAVEMPAPPPAVPVLAPPPPPLATTPTSKHAAAPPGPALAALDLSNPPRLDAAQRASLDDVAAAYRAKPGTVKIIAYAMPVADSPDQLGSFRAALDRAQFVAAALVQAGVPNTKIQTEAAPATAGAGPGRVELRLVP